MSENTQESRKGLFEEQKQTKKSWKQNLKLSFARFSALVKKYLKITLRNKQNYFWILGYPLLFMVIFSIAMQGGGRSTYQIAIINEDVQGIESPEIALGANVSRQIENLFKNGTELSETFDRVSHYSNGTQLTRQDAYSLVEKEAIDAVIIIPQNFSEVVIGSTWWYKGLKSGALDLSEIGEISPSLQGLAVNAMSGTDFPEGKPSIEIKSVADTVTQTVIQGVFQGIVNDMILGYNNVSMLETNASVSRVDRKVSYYDVFAPGIVGVGVLVAISNVATMFALDQSKGIMKRLDTTPVPRRTQLLSGGTAQFLFSSVQVIILLACLPLFGVNTHPDASWFLAFIVGVSLSFTCIGLGLIISSFSKDPDSASGASWIIILPLQFLGGGFFPMDQSITKWFPSHYSIHGLKMVLTYGFGWADVIGNILINLAFGVVFIIIGLYIFSKKSEI